MGASLAARPAAACPSDPAAVESMVNLTVKLRGGSEQALQAASGVTLMEAIRKGGIDEVVAMCGGSCSCATCHVYVETGPASVRTPANEDEDDLLDSSDHRTANSRLSCQIRLDEALEGLVVQIAPEN